MEEDSFQRQSVGPESSVLNPLFSVGWKPWESVGEDSGAGSDAELLCLGYYGLNQGISQCWGMFFYGV